MPSGSKTTTAAKRRERLGGPDLAKMVRPPTHPGEVLLKEFLEPLGYGAQGAAADAMGMSRNRLNEIVMERRPVTAESAVLIGALTGTDPRMWLHMQADRDLWQAMHDVDVTKIQPLKKAG